MSDSHAAHQHDHAARHHDGPHQQAPHGEEAWDERYRSQPEIWSGDPNAALVAEVADLPPGRALRAHGQLPAAQHRVAQVGERGRMR